MTQPKVLRLVEVAKMIGVSKQRADQPGRRTSVARAAFSLAKPSCEALGPLSPTGTRPPPSWRNRQSAAGPAGALTQGFRM
jgi:hypothetical protein